MQPSKGREATYAIPDGSLSIGVSNEDCQSANALLVCKVPLRDQAGAEWPRGKWMEVDKVHERLTFKSLAWLLERAKSNVEKFDVWTNVCLPDGFNQCGRCAPAAPSIRWMKLDKKIRAIEDTSQAGAYERALKNRPTPFVTQLKLDDDSGVGDRSNRRKRTIIDPQGVFPSAQSQSNGESTACMAFGYGLFRSRKIRPP